MDSRQVINGSCTCDHFFFTLYMLSPAVHHCISFGTARLDERCGGIMNGFLLQNTEIVNIFQEGFVREQYLHGVDILFLFFHVPFKFGSSILEPCDYLQKINLSFGISSLANLKKNMGKFDRIFKLTWAFDSPNEAAISSRSAGDRYF